MFLIFFFSSINYNGIPASGQTAEVATVSTLKFTQWRTKDPMLSIFIQCDAS